MKEREAIAQLKRGDIRGLETLVQQYQVRALRTACLITRDRALAEDLVQSAFLRAFERIHQFDDNRPFGPWFLRSVVNDAVKAVTRQRREVPLPEEPGVGSGHGDATLIAPDAAPDELLEQSETYQELGAALGQLPAAQRAVLVQRYFLGLSEHQMAAAAACPPGTVKRRLHTARGRLRVLLRLAEDDAKP